MPKTKIEWCDISINPVKGLCPMDCKNLQGKPYCYARKLYKRFHWDETIRYNLYWTKGLPNNPSKIFIGSTFELFGDWVKKEWMDDILSVVRNCDEHTFIFLTKQPRKLKDYLQFPDNAWIGVSAWDSDSFDNAIQNLREVNAKVKFISLEPLLDWTHTNGLKYPLALIQWLIMGQQTPVRESTMPQIEWIKEIVIGANEANMPIFLKNNLKSLTGEVKTIDNWMLFDNCTGLLRQEFPKV